MTGVPAPTLYHRWLGWHAPAMRRALTAFVVGVIVTVVLLPFVTWAMALVAGWDAAALTVLLSIWPLIIRADSSLAPQLAAREDETEDSTRALLVGASVASLLGAGYALHLAGLHSAARGAADGVIARSSAAGASRRRPAPLRGRRRT